MTQFEDWSYLKGIIAYQGTYYNGWQSQKDGKSVQDIVEKSLLKLFKLKQRIAGASRTDAGVHAFGQVLKLRCPILNIDINCLLKIINENLSTDICLRKLEYCDELFSPRFDAKKKLYNYFISSKKIMPWNNTYVALYKYKYNFDIFNQALSQFIGTHDFTAFSTGSENKNAIRIIYRCEAKIINEDLIMVSIEGNGFLRYMVRRIIAAALTIATKNHSTDIIIEYLNNKNSSNQLYNMPPNGLILTEIGYKEEDMLKDFELKV